MADLTLTRPARSGTAIVPAAVAASATIPRSMIGPRGVTLTIFNDNAASDTVGITDASVTKTGAAASAVSQAVANGTKRAFKILPEQADPTSKAVTVTHSVTSSVTYTLTPND